MTLYLFLTDAVAQGARDEPGEVLRTLIVSLGGFCAGVAFVQALWRLSPWVTRRGRVAGWDLFLGVLLLAFAGLAVLTTDHIHQHLVEDDTPLWQLWMALGSFTIGAVALVGMIATRATRTP